MRRMLVLIGSMMMVMAGSAYAEGDMAAGKKVFKKCTACHAVGAKAKHKVGPLLNGVVGREWGVFDKGRDPEGLIAAKSAKPFKYSKSLNELATAEKKVWDIETLSAYLRKPKDVIPKGKMAFAGLKKDEDITNVITYMAAFDAEGNEVDPAEVLSKLKEMTN